MPADLDAEIRTRIAEAIEALAVDADAYGYSVTWSLVQAGNQTALGWQLLITCRSPLLGHAPVAAIGAVVSASVPTPPELRDAVAKALAELQATTRKLLKAGNGHAPTLPGKVS